MRIDRILLLRVAERRNRKPKGNATEPKVTDEVMRGNAFKLWCKGGLLNKQGGGKETARGLKG